jgi:hypothetical protein
MKFLNKEKIKNIIYDHWKALLPTILPFLGVVFLSFWDYFRDLMLKPVPFFVLFIILIVLGSLFSWNFFLRKNVRSLKEKNCSDSKFIFKDNLLYKKDGEGVYCPACHERDNKISRMKETYTNDIYGQDGVKYQCFVCNYQEFFVFSNGKENPSDIPF